MKVQRFILFAACLLVSCATQTVTTQSLPAQAELVRPTVTNTVTPTATATRTPQIPKPTPRPLATSVLVQKACETIVCDLSGHFVFQNPIPDSGLQVSDATYRFGSTQNGTRETHHGVEFPNKAGTPVLAVAAGQVIFAGNDDVATLAWVPKFYGNVVVIRHFFAGTPLPIFTLYAHLQDVYSHEGERVLAGQAIGSVGSTGTAVGSHLHFEVRLGANRYANVQNPILWLMPISGHGVLAGKVVDTAGKLVAIELNVQPYKDGALHLEPYTALTTYETKELPVSSDPVVQENFAAGDIPAGQYRVSLVWQGKLFEQSVSVQAGRLTYITFVVK